MDGEAITRHNVLERMLLDDSAEPTNLTLSLLEAITKDFSDELQIGRGGFAVVYKGMLRNGTVAVKKLKETLDIDEKQFNREVKCLMGVKHKNIVRFLGYCSDTQGKFEKYNEKFVMADVRNRLLCFEYLPKGNLHGYIIDASRGLEWKVRYQVIKGICEGLHYLHKKNIAHLDLKPANILLDDSMQPKIADFGLARLFDEKQTGTIIASKLNGTPGYLAPEFYSGRITLKLDIYSLGIIITEILTGEKGYSAIEEVVKSWMNRLEVSEGDTLLEQVRVCAEIGIECLNIDPAKRPVTQHIIERIDKTTNTVWSIETGTSSSSATQVVESWMNRLEISEGDTLLEQVRVRAEIGNECMNSDPAKRPVTQHMIERLDKTGNPDWSVETGMSSSSAAQADNASIEQHQGVPIVLQGETSSEVLATEPWVPLAPSDGACEILSVEPLQLLFPFDLEPNESMILCPLHLTNRTDHHVNFRLMFTENYIMGPLFGVVPPRCRYTLALTMRKQAKPPAKSYEFFTLESYMMAWGFRDAVHRVNLMALYEPPGPGKATSEPMKRRIMIQSEITNTRSLDVHPTEPWILAKEFDQVVIWNYQTQEIRDVQLFEVTSVKFVYRKQWFVAGGRDGSIYVYSCDTMKKIRHFRRAHSKDVNSLAIHATEPYLLSASSDGHIKLWDYEKDWKLIRVWQSRNVCHVAFSPKDTNIFATVDWDFTVKIWNLHHLSECTLTLSGPGMDYNLSYARSGHYLDYFSRGNELYLIACCGWNTFKIWDYQTGSCVKTLGEYTKKVNTVCSHPDLPILITGSDDGTVCLWSSTTFELECTLNFGLGRVYAIGCLQGSSRIVIAYLEGLVLTEIDLGQAGASMERQ